MQWHKAVQWPSGCNWPHACQCHLCWHAKASEGQRWYILPGHLRGQPRTVHPFPQKVPNCGEPANFHLKKKEKKIRWPSNYPGIFKEFAVSYVSSTSVFSNSAKLRRTCQFLFKKNIEKIRWPWNYPGILKEFTVSNAEYVSKVEKI